MVVGSNPAGGAIFLDTETFASGLESREGTTFLDTPLPSVSIARNTA